jgi:hypothetical protein
VSLTLTRVQEHASFEVLSLRSLLILWWKQAPTLATVAASNVVVDDQLSRSTSKMVFCAVVAPNIAIPDGPTRDALQNAIKRTEPRLHAAVNVILATGFAAAAVRGAFTGFSLIVRPSYPLAFVGTMAEAASKISRVWPAADPPPPDVTELTAALDALARG